MPGVCAMRATAHTGDAPLAGKHVDLAAPARPGAGACLGRSRALKAPEPRTRPPHSQVKVFEKDMTAIRGEGKYRGPIQVGGLHGPRVCSADTRAPLKGAPARFDGCARQLFQGI